jgi:hypothetical protein
MKTNQVNYKLLSDLLSFSEPEQMYINNSETLDIQDLFGVVEDETAKAGIYIYSDELSINLNKPSKIYNFPDKNFCGFNFLLFFEL